MPVPTALTGYTIDPASVETLTAKFTMSGTGLGTATVDTSQAPVLVNATTNTYMFWLNGAFAATGTVTINFIPGSYSFEPSSYAARRAQTPL